MSDLRAFFGPNAGYVLELYERYTADPASVSESDRAFFASLDPSALTTRRPGNGTRAVVRQRRGRRPGGRRDARSSARPRSRSRSASTGTSAPGSTRSASRCPAPRSSIRHSTASPRPIWRRCRRPSSAVRLAEGAPNAAEAMRRLREIYSGTVGYDFDHVQVAAERLWLLDAVESGKFAAPLESATRAGAAAPADAGRGVRAVPAPDLPRPEALLDRGQRRPRADARRDRPRRRRRRHPRGRDRHGPPRPPQRADPCPRQAVRGHHPGLRGQEEVQGGRRRSVERQRPVRRFLRRRQVPPRRPPAARRARDGGRGADGPRPEPEPPRGGQPGRRGHGPRLAGHHRPAGRAGLRPPRQRRDRHPRRCGLPRSGRRRRDAEHGRPARLLDRRHDPHHRQQPGRLHDRPARLPLDPLRQRPGQGLRDSRSSMSTPTIPRPA